MKLNVTKLREEVKTNPTLNALIHMFALRERTKVRVTISNLRVRMAREGFSFAQKDYEAALKFLNELGIGRLMTNKSGRVLGLDGIDIKLQSLGKVALGQGTRLRTHKSRVALKPNVKLVSTDSPPKPKVRNPDPYPVYLTIIVEGRPMIVRGPDSVEPNNLGDFLTRFKSIGKDI